VEGEMPWAVAGGQRNERNLRGRKLTCLGIKFVDVQAVLRQVGCENKFAGGIGLNHVRVRMVVSADGKVAAGPVGRVL
jgi:hypothetical protein